MKKLLLILTVVLALAIPASSGAHGAYSSPTGWYCSQYNGYILAYINENTAYVCLYHQIYIVHANH